MTGSDGTRPSGTGGLPPADDPEVGIHSRNGKGEAAAAEPLAVIVAGESLVPPLTGVGIYTRALVEGLRHHPAIGRVECLAWGRRVDPDAVPPAGGGWRRALRAAAARLPGAARLHDRVRRILAARTARAGTPVIHHEPNAVLRPVRGPCVVTVHDLSHLRFPQFLPRERVRHLERGLPRSIARADHIVTPSDFVRDELISRLGAAPDRVTAIPLGVDPVFRPRDAVGTAPTLAGRDLAHGCYVLSAATFEPRKNLAGLVSAYRRLDPRLRRAFPLVLCGAPGWRSAALEDEIDRLVRAGEARRLGYVGREALARLVAGAAVLAYVSFYEGFGLPVLEAMASGVPVLASSRTALPEVAGTAGVLTDPYEPEDIALHLRVLLEDAALRRRRAAAGLARAALFPWSRCIDRTVAVYRRVRVENPAR